MYNVYMKSNSPALLPMLNKMKNLMNLRLILLPSLLLLSYRRLLLSYPPSLSFEFSTRTALMGKLSIWSPMPNNIDQPSI